MKVAIDSTTRWSDWTNSKTLPTLKKMQFIALSPSKKDLMKSDLDTKII